MTPAAALADRHRAVRVAAQGWRRAGVIDDATLARIDAAYPDDRARLGPVFRALAFVFGVFALNAFFGVIAIASGGATAFGSACLVFAVMLVAATEVLTGPLRRADSGIETASALLSVVYALVAFGFLSHDAFGSEQALISALLALAVLLAAAGSVRWGSPLLAALAVVCAFVLLARLPAGRVLWIAAALAAAPWLLLGSESRALPPSHRRSLQIGLLLALGALYVAVHVGSWDYRWLEWLADFRAAAAARPGALRTLSIVATAVVPLAIMAFGVSTRRASLVNLGVLLGVASVMTLRFYVHVAPVWVVLVAAGTAALVVVLAVRRVLASGPGNERGGFTAEPLFEDPARRHATEVVGAMATFAPAAQPAAEPVGLHPGGGRYGGGGATGDF